jgi:hypothetical protein
MFNCSHCSYTAKRKIYVDRHENTKHKQNTETDNSSTKTTIKNKKTHNITINLKPEDDDNSNNDGEDDILFLFIKGLVEAKKESEEKFQTLKKELMDIITTHLEPNDEEEIKRITENVKNDKTKYIEDADEYPNVNKFLSLIINNR